jgi:hypothetical protein
MLCPSVCLQVSSPKLLKWVSEKSDIGGLHQILPGEFYFESYLSDTYNEQIMKVLCSSGHFLATDTEVPGSIPGAIYPLVY